MAVHTEVVPYCWTTLDQIVAGDSLLPGTYVTPYRIPRASLADCGRFAAGELVHVPLGASDSPAVVARFFRDGYEWIPLPDEVDVGGMTLASLFAALFEVDKLRFAHFDPVLVTAMAMQAAGGLSPGAQQWQMLDPGLLPFADLAWLHFDYWENSRYRAEVVNNAVQDAALNLGITTIHAPWFGSDPLTGLLAGVLPAALPVEHRGQKLARVLARRRVRGTSVRAVARRVDGEAVTTLNVVDFQPPRIELDGWNTQTLYPMRPDEWRLGASRVRFRLTIPYPALQVRVEIVRDDAVYYQETHELGEFIVPGVHVFTWDGRDTNGAWDSAALKGSSLVARLIVVDAVGHVSVATSELGVSPSNVRWVDARIDPSERAVRVTTYARFSRPSELKLFTWDCGFSLPPGETLASTLSQGALGLTQGLPGASLLPQVPGMSSLPELGPSGLPIPPGVPQVSLVGSRLRLTVFLPPFLDLDEVRFQTFKGEILDGIRKHWSRTGHRAVHIDGEPYDLHVRARERSTDANQTFLARTLPEALDSLGIGSGESLPEGFGSRSCNLAFMEGWPIIDIWRPADEDIPLRRSYLGAHEMGHTVLREYRSLLVTMTHKGTSSVFQKHVPSTPFYPAEDDHETDIDVMFYYNSDDEHPDWDADHDAEYSDRTFATEDDARGLITLAAVVFG